MTEQTQAPTKVNEKALYDTSFYSIRRAHPKDLPNIIDLIISEPYFRWKEIAMLTFNNIYVTVTWFIGALCTMGLAILYFIQRDIQYQSRAFYITLAVLAALIIFSLCYMKAFSLYFLRYLRAFEIQSELKKMDKNALKDNLRILQNEKVHLFWKMYNFYVAEPFDQPSKQLFLGCIALSAYADYCKDKQVNDTDFECIVKAIPNGFQMVSQKTIVISYLTVNEKFFANSKHEKSVAHKLRNSIYNGLLQYVANKVVKDTSINYMIVESDDFLWWQHDILAHNEFGFCGERIDVKWNWLYDVTKDGYPNNKYFFIKVCNIDPKAFQRALDAQAKSAKRKRTQSALI